MDYQNIDFNKDVVTMYSQLRERMVERFPYSFVYLTKFGSCSVKIEEKWTGDGLELLLLEHGHEY